MNKKILIIANDFTTVYNFRLELIEYLISHKQKVFIALPNDKRNDVFISLGVNIIPLNINRFGTNPIEDLKTTFTICKIIKDIKPDIVFTYTAKPNIYGGLACRFSKTPYVANITGLGSNFEKQNIIAKIMLVLQKIAYKKAKMVFFQNNSNLEFFKSKKIIKKNFGLLPGSGVNLKSNAYQDMPYNDTVKFITVARIRKDKGYDELFKAINRATNETLNAEFHIVGWYEDEEYKTKIESFNNNKNVIFYNGVSHEEVYKLLVECDCLIHPSHHEGMSNVILEASATGRPSIVSNIPGCAEGVTDGKSGFYFEVKNTDDLYEKIKYFTTLSHQKKSDLGKAARQKAESEFDRQIVIDKYYELI